MPGKWTVEHRKRFYKTIAARKKMEHKQSKPMYHRRRRLGVLTIELYFAKNGNS